MRKDYIFTAYIFAYKNILHVFIEDLPLGPGTVGGAGLTAVDQSDGFLLSGRQLPFEAQPEPWAVHGVSVWTSLTVGREFAQSFPPSAFYEQRFYSLLGESIQASLSETSSFSPVTPASELTG